MEMGRATATSPELEYRVGPVRDIPEGGGVLVVADGTEVGVFRVRGAVHAYENRCLHQGGPVCTGEIVGRYEQVLAPDGTVSGERFVDEEPRIACPWHGWEYDLETGRCTADRRYRLRRVPVTVRDGDVFVRI
jgi:nitrite reductase/ring-hydroxylating ferredoxin subunit